ncbi:dTDP-glucose 4,6-dehydratase [Candidatus Methylacidithermus pantelleriae]|uniref:dTDP-glucose 4,6-dehydratase n=1 Tax=Candidatus Methylacidithermus pantelleriae TaxID=2744239 RepID=UPI001F3AABF2|nr:dTDP-glucose 4,6-dehydratase [Candidatus Methylacidithermus pantelleriae]
MTEEKSWLITGGAGFIGSNLIRWLLLEQPASQAPVRLINLDKLTYAGNLANLKEVETDPRYCFVHGSMGDKTLVAEILRQHQVGVLLHLAAESHVDRSIDEPEQFARTNVLETVSLLETVLQYWKELPRKEAQRFRFVHVSTDEVFGSLLPQEEPFTEKTPYNPSSPYAASKAGADHFVRAYGRTFGLPVVLTHSSNNYGPYQFPEKLLPLTILNALEERPLPLYGDGLQVRDWIYVLDHCRALHRVIHKGKPGESYAIGGGVQISNLDLVRKVCRILDERRPRPGGKKHEELLCFVADRPGHDRRYATNPSKIVRELGWKPLEDLESGLAKTVDWYLAHQDWCREITEKRYARQRLGLRASSRNEYAG